MSRVKFLRINPKNFLEKVQNETGFTFQKLADICKAHRRSFSDWKYGDCLMPFFVFRKLVKISGINPPTIQTLPDYWYTKYSSRKGGLATYKKYGKVPGWTREASRRGALKAIKTHRKRGTGLFTFKSVFLPRHSLQLAEFVGILLGDGSITPRQITITLNKLDDQDFVLYVKNVIQKLFAVDASITRA